MTYRLYQMADSGNCYKVRLTMAHLQQPLETVEVDITQGQSRTAEFMQKNPVGKVPTLELPDGRFLSESNAIIWYLAQASSLIPEGTFEQAKVLQWFGFEQYSHEPNIATSRYWIKIINAEHEYKAQIKQKQASGYQALDVMESHLKHEDFFVGTFSLADIALYAYTHVCHEGGFSLENYAAIRAWLERVRSQAGHVAIHES